MIRLIQALLVMCLSAVAFAGEDFDRTITAFTAMTLNQIKSLADLQKFDLGTANTKILKDELVKNGRAPFAPKKIEQTGATTIKLQFARSAVVLDLKEISSGIIYVNDRQVKMDNKKTYFNYKAEVDAILAMKKKDAFLRLIFAEAVAADEDPGSYISWAVVKVQRGLAVIARVDMSSPEKLKNSAIFNADLEESIIISQKAMLDSSAATEQAIKFTCEGKRVKSVELKFADSTAASLTEMLDGSWSMIDHGANPPTVRADSNGKVTSAGSGYSNLFKSDPFYEFPQIAKRCCMKAGCYAKVSAAFSNAESSAKRKAGRSSGAR